MGLSLVFLSSFYFFTWPLLFISFSLSLYLSTLPLILLLYSEPDPHHSHSGGASLPGCRWRRWCGSGEEQEESVPGASHPGAQPYI